MIVFDLQCTNGHLFEGWFESREAFEEQRKGGLIECPHCGNKEIKRLLSPVSHSKGKNVEASERQELSPKDLLKKVWEFIDKNFEDVGHKFAAEALKIHYGVTEPRNIKGIATAEEEDVLQKEGVQFIKIPSFGPSIKGNTN